MRVFISSTSQDLQPYRAAARDVVLDLGWHPVMMEHFGTDGVAGVLNACRRRVLDCDVVLAILAWKLGGVPNVERGGDGKTSYTQWELKTADEEAMPVLALMANEDWPQRLWEDDAEAQAAVKNFRGELDRLAVFFEWEEVRSKAKEPLPWFQAKVRQELVRHQQRLIGFGEPKAEAESQLRLREWPKPDWPDRPYPLLLPYTHPGLFAGRSRDIAKLHRLVLLPQPIFCLHSASGAGKSSLLAAGLVPVLRAEGRPVAFERRPADPGLAGRLVGDLLEPGDDDRRLEVDDEKPETFVKYLLAAERLAGAPSLLVLDQLEDLIRPEATGARARLGLLLAASVQRQPGREGPSCRWLLAYRQDFHGQVSSWLRDILADARRLEPQAAKNLPHDLSDADRSHAWPLPPLGTPPPGVDRIEEAVRAFREAIETPLAVAADGDEPRYRWRFAGDGAGCLAHAFAKARDGQPDAPLVPELQVVLAHLLQQAGDPRAGEVVEIPVPERLDTVIDQALEDHLRRAMDAAFIDLPPTAAREGRTRVLLALRELADAEGKRGESLAAEDLTSAIGTGGAKVLQALARRDTRLIVPLERAEGRRYALSHDRLAEVVVRMVEEEGLHGDLDTGLLSLRRFVRLNTELYRSAEREQATRIPHGRFRRIATHRQALIRDEHRRQWWAACERRRRADVRRLTLRSVVAAVAVLVIGLWFWTWVEKRAEQSEVLSSFLTGDVEGVLVGVEENRHNEEVLRAVELALPRLREKSQDLKLIGTVAWALDYFPGQDPLLAEGARILRQEVLDTLRKLYPPPEIGATSDTEWAEIPSTEDAFSRIDSARAVKLSSFRILTHEVTNCEFRQLVPDHKGKDELPAINVNWFEAYAYAAWLGGRLDGRLPTEAEWEYAARAGCPHEYCDRDGNETRFDKVAWYRETSGYRLHPVMRLEPNRWGLYDMYGNVWEWVADLHGEYPEERQVDPMGPPSGGSRVIRGGSCKVFAKIARAANRLGRDPEVERFSIGFRVVLPGAPSR